MLSNALIVPVLPVTDLDRAKKFYTEKVGLKVSAVEEPGGIAFDCGMGTRLFVYQRPPVKVEHTQASFEVEDLEAEVKDLKSRGVVFEEYDQPMPGIKTVNSIATMGEAKAAWFKDPDGNIIAIGQLKK